MGAPSQSSWDESFGPCAFPSPGMEQLFTVSLLGHHCPCQPQDAAPEPTEVLFALGQERAPAWLSRPGVPQLSPTPLCVSVPHPQQRIWFVFIPNRVFSLPLSVFWRN